MRDQYGRRDRLVQEERHDTYRGRGKLPEPAVCGRCGALFAGGRWSWQEAPPGAARVTCPACQRAEDGYPAGRVEIRGDFFRRHRDEILNLVRNEEAAEKAARPMERIMAVEETADGVLVLTTGVHVARRIGEALARAYQGDFSFQYAEGEKRIRVSWSR
ncbi:ATPase [Dissulfurirhabdus thermomarina]|uniref:ATPase n=1 Tax=Dissulfurirhabdus thermomarina TaxID=1765737 RepID=A0A6N9TNE1_DISTH|nr:BCAM0308 family protein [Dissulfurirhabdus thermomarina]NDY42659.1 ATPase [Dissulfurirhabdus thermomarina]NMX23446.1 ATPase [Dissulfurirhabdus thermomarina]